jgi:LysM repeat protein
MRRWTGRSVLITITLCLLSFLPVQAQQNLLQNPGFESGYSGRMGHGDFNFPSGWDGWFTDAPHTEAWMNVPPTGYPHNGPFRRSGTNSQSIAKGGGTFTAAALQRVPDIPAGAVVRGSAWVFIENNDGTNAQVRIGVGSNVGTNVYGAITWSGWEKRLNGQQQISIDHIATGGEVTIFIYATQTWPNDPNAVYIDDASLTIVGEGDVPVESEGGEDNTVVEVSPPDPSGVAFVVPQGSEDDGAIIHIVGSGDTLSSISVAYGVSVDEILALNGLSKSSFLQPDQRLIISIPEPTPVEPESQPTEVETEDIIAPVETEDAEATEETVVDTDEAQATIEIAGPIVTGGAEVPTQNATDAPTETPAESPTPSTTPTETPIPDTATPAPTAPVAEADAQDVDPTTLKPGICVGVFEDSNQNGVLEAGDVYLANGLISLNDSNDEELESYLTDGESEPFCFDGLDAGRYSLKGIAPDGYGITTSPILRVNLEDGETVTVRFGAKQGLEVFAIPTVDTRPTEAPSETDRVSDDQNDLMEFSGLIVFGLAGVVLVFGFGASLLMRRR